MTHDPIHPRWTALTVVLIVVVPVIVGAVFLSTRPSGPSVPDVFLYVNDLTDPPTLLSDEFDALTDLCYEVDARTSAEIAIVVVNSTQPYGINVFAGKTFEANGIGKRGLDNGVMILLSTDEREWRIEVGYGLESVLTDTRVAGIARTYLVPALASGEIFTGLFNTTLAVGQEIVDHYDPGSVPVQRPRLFVMDWTLLCVVFGGLIFVGLIAAVIVNKRGFPSSGGPSTGMVNTGTTSTTNLDFSGFVQRGQFGGGRSGGGGAGGKF